MNPVESSMITRSFLIFLWWKELVVLAVLTSVAVLVGLRMALRRSRSRDTSQEEGPVNIAERLKNLTEQL